MLCHMTQARHIILTNFTGDLVLKVYIMGQFLVFYIDQSFSCYLTYDVEYHT